MHHHDQERLDKIVMIFPPVFEYSHYKIAGKIKNDLFNPIHIWQSKSINKIHFVGHCQTKGSWAVVPRYKHKMPQSQYGLRASKRKQTIFGLNRVCIFTAHHHPWLVFQVPFFYPVAWRNTNMVMWSWSLWSPQKLRCTCDRCLQNGISQNLQEQTTLSNLSRWRHTQNTYQPHVELSREKVGWWFVIGNREYNLNRFFV